MKHCTLPARPQTADRHSQRQMVNIVGHLAAKYLLIHYLGVGGDQKGYRKGPNI